MKKLLLLILLPFVGNVLAQPPPIQTEPLSVNAAHTVFPTDMTSGIITDAMSALSGKPWCRLVSTSDTSLSGTPTIDSSATTVGDVVLLTAQTTGSQNGPWIVASGAWSRPAWYASGQTTQAFLNVSVQIRVGTQFAGTWWRITTATAITIDTTSTSWSQTARTSLTSGVVNTLPAANFPALTGDVTNTAGSLATTISNAVVTYAKIQNVAGLSVVGRSANSSGVGADITGTDGQALRVSGTTLGFGTIATAGIADGSITFAKMANLAANSIIGNSTGSAAVPTALGIGTGIATFLATPTSANLASAITNETGTAGALVFSASPTLTGLTLVNGNLQIGAGTTSPQPLVAILGTPVAFTAKIGASGSYAQFALKNELDAQRGFIGYIGSTFSNPLRQDHFEFGTAAGVPIHFRPGDGDGVGFSMDERSVLHIANVATSTGTKLIAFPATSQPAAIPAGSPACGQLYMSPTGQLSFLTPTGTPYAITP